MSDQGNTELSWNGHYGGRGAVWKEDQVIQGKDVCALKSQWVAGKAGQTGTGAGQSTVRGKPNPRRATFRLNRGNPREMANQVSKCQW